jgi:cyclopropane fatty-acyl-phospholipid synthase-like methyltransferase
MDFFNSVYNGRPPWDTGRPQTEFIQLEQAGEIVGSVLDVGCGTGENALERHLTVKFLSLNVLELHTLGRTFDTVIDSGLFHVLSDEERALFVDNLATVIHRGGTYFMLCFSELEPEGYGPRRITQAEIKNSFLRGGGALIT